MIILLDIFTGVVSITLSFHPQGRNVNDVTNGSVYLFKLSFSVCPDFGRSRFMLFYVVICFRQKLLVLFPLLCMWVAAFVMVWEQYGSFFLALSVSVTVSKWESKCCFLGHVSLVMV